MKYFTLSEFLNSSTAIKYNISNVPDAKTIANITDLVNGLLDPLREAWTIYCNSKGYSKSGIIVSSGYRCPALNSKVGGAKTSAHLTGNAADLIPANGKIKEFILFTQDWIKTKAFDQCINEYGKWCHVGYKNNSGLQRRQIFKIS